MSSTSYLSLLHSVSQELGNQDSRGLGFLAGVRLPRASGCCRGCCAGDPLELLQLMQEQGAFSQYDLGPLVDLLREVGREDLASKCEQFPAAKTMAAPAETPVHPGSHTTCTSLPRLNSSWDDLSSPLTTPTSSLMQPSPSRCKHQNKLCSFTRRVTRKLFRHRPAVTGSRDEGLDSFHVVDHRDLTGYPDHTHPGDCAGRKLLCSHSFESTLLSSRRDRSWTAGSVDSGLSSAESSLSPTHAPIWNHTPYQGGLPTCVWPLKRDELIGPIFKHSNKAIEKRFNMRGGTKESGCGLTFVLKLYPNGVNWDQDSSASLHVDIATSLGPRTSSIVYFEVKVVEDRSTSREVLSHRRRVCRLKEEREFMITEFLPHQVVKTSRAKLLCILFHVELSYLLGEDWVCIGGDQDLGCVMDPAYL